MKKYYKYPKSFHILGSKIDPHGNDLWHDNVAHFLGKEVIYTIKLDGENFSMYRDKTHARSIDSGAHPSRTWIKAYYATIRHLIPDGWRFCFENLQAKHSIAYENLPTYAFLIGIYNDANVCLSWHDTEVMAEELGLYTVPVLYCGIWDEKKFKNCYIGRTIINGVDTGLQEGMVVRLANAFRYDDFAYSVGKWVVPNFVPGDSGHWSKTGYKPNKLIK